MGERWTGCDMNCFDCRYDDCIIPSNILVKRIKKSALPAKPIWTDEQNGYIRDHAYESISELARQMGIGYTSLQRHIRETSDLDRLFPAKHFACYNEIMEWVRDHPHCTINEIATGIDRDRSAVGSAVWRLIRYKKLRRDSAKMPKPMHVWINEQETENENSLQ